MNRNALTISQDSPDSDAETTRRQFLAAGGAVALGSMAGCLGRVASSMTETSSSPAGVLPGGFLSGGVEGLHAGFESPTSRAFDVADSRVESVPATIKSSGVFSASLDLESWSVDAVRPANDYNSVRSNKRRSAVGITPDELDGDEDDADEDDERFETLLDELYEYLETEPVVGETASVCLPDADIPRGPTIADEITPERIFGYLTSEKLEIEREGHVYAWGNNAFKSVRDDDIDVMAWSWGANRAELLVPERSNRSIVTHSRGSDVVVSVLNHPPRIQPSRQSAGGSINASEWWNITAGDPRRPVPGTGGGGRVSIQSTLGRGGGAGKVRIQEWPTAAGWGEESESDGVTATPVIVAPALALPEGAPLPIPAVVYVRRCNHEGEYIYTGGWVVDDGALYEDSCTLLTFQGPNEVVSFTPEDVASQDTQRALSQRVRRGIRRNPRGASLYRGDVDGDLLAAVPEAFRDGEGRRELAGLVDEVVQRNNGGRNPQTGKEIKIPLRDGPVGDEYDVMHCVATAIDCPLVHLTDADDDEKAESMDAFLKIEGISGEDERQ